MPSSQKFAFIAVSVLTLFFIGAGIWVVATGQNASNVNEDDVQKLNSITEIPTINSIKIPTITRDVQPILPDERVIHTSGDSSVTMTFEVGTFSDPSVVEYMRVSEGDPANSDAPPRVPLAFHSYASFTLWAVRATDETSIEPTLPITIEMRAPVDDERAADLKTLRIVEEFGSHRDTVPSIVSWDEGQQVATATFTILRMGTYRLIASSLVSPTTVAATSAPIPQKPLTVTCPPPPDCSVPPPPSCDKTAPVYDANGCLLKCGTPGC